MAAKQTTNRGSSPQPTARGGSAGASSLAANARNRSPSPRAGANAASNADSMPVMTVKEFAEYMNRENSRSLIMQEFQKEREFSKNKLQEQGFERKACDKNRTRNRFKNYPCLDATRVELLPYKSHQQQQFNDYIHANWVDGYNKKKAFICTQAPLSGQEPFGMKKMDETVNDFWLMIWQQNVKLIFMPTAIAEEEENEYGEKVVKQKCAAYWPQKVDEMMELNDFRIKCKSLSKQGNDYIITDLLLGEKSKNADEDKKAIEKTGRLVKHFQFIGWPDHSVPNENFYKLFRDMDNAYSNPDNIPIVVHCSAGVGRTGTLIALHNCYKQLIDTGKVQILKVLRDLRRQRYGSLQRAEQYVLLHQALLKLAQEKGLIQK